MALDAEQMAGALAVRGFRLTRQRRAVLDAVAEASSSVSPVQVFDAARERCPELGLTTVYRTLELLSEIGALRRPWQNVLTWRHRSRGTAAPRARRTTGTLR